MFYQCGNFFWCGRPIFSAKKKKADSSQTNWLGLGLVRVRLSQAFFLLKKMVDRSKRHDKNFPDFYTLSSIIIQ